MPNWLAFLVQILPGDADTIKYLQKLAGYLLSGSAAAELTHFFYGVGSNGKTTVRETLSEVVGEYGLTSEFSLLMKRKKNPSQATPEIAELEDKRAVFILESDVTDVLDGGVFKAMASNEKQKGSGLFKNPVEFMPQHKIIFCTNHLPIVTGSELGMWRRIRAIPFTTVIENPDLNFREKKLMPELSGILNWAVVIGQQFIRTKS